MKIKLESCLGFIILYVLLFDRQGVYGISVNTSVSPEIPELGDNPFRLECLFTVETDPVEELQTILLQRMRASENGFTTIVTFPRATSIHNATFSDTALADRCVATKPSATFSSSASLECSSTECGDKALYKWTVRYSIGSEEEVERQTDVRVKVSGTFNGSSDYGLTYSPNINITDGTNVTFTCLADIGTEPLGQLEWYYYLPGSVVPTSIPATDGPLVPARNCSYTRESMVTLTMSREYDGIVVRCTLQQDTLTPDGDAYRQIEAIYLLDEPTSSTEATTTTTPTTTIQTTTPTSTLETTTPTSTLETSTPTTTLRTTTPTSTLETTTPTSTLETTTPTSTLRTTTPTSTLRTTTPTSTLETTTPTSTLETTTPTSTLRTTTPTSTLETTTPTSTFEITTLTSTLETTTPTTTLQTTTVLKTTQHETTTATSSPTTFSSTLQTTTPAESTSQTVGLTVTERTTQRSGSTESLSTSSVTSTLSPSLPNNSTVTGDSETTSSQSISSTNGFTDSYSSEDGIHLSTVYVIFYVVLIQSLVS